MKIEKTVRERFKEILESTFIRNYDIPEVKQKRIQNFCIQVQELKPQKLFRYREFNENTFDALQKNLITSSKPQMFNDPFDSLIYVNKEAILQEVRDPRNRWKFQRWLELNPKLTANLTKKQRKQINSLLSEHPRKYALSMRLASPKLEKMIDGSIRDCVRYIKNYQNIVCFSETQTSPTMWAYYADSHKGFVVEYDFKNYHTPCLNCSHKCAYQHYETLFPVIYSDERFDAKDFVAAFWSHQMLINSPVEVFVPKDDELALYKTLLHKSNDWSHEKEWRIISQCDTFPKIVQKPLAIYLGVNMPQENRSKLLDFATKNNIATFEMYIDNTSRQYQINYREIKKGV
jgi:hypothetical protein